MTPFGLINIHKPIGLTSRQVVDRVGRGLGRGVKLGHAGTLDPLAEGVLVLAVGKATRLVSYVQQMRKRYCGTFLLGRSSDTEDTEGEIQLLDNPHQPTADEVRAVLPRFVGTIDQRPPAYSALKVDGRRAYKLAREGKTVDLPPRPVTVYELSLEALDYPTLTLNITCGAGTYVRSLGRDIALAVGSAAVMSALVRTAIGPFDLATAVALADAADEPARHILSAALALEQLPQVNITDDEIRRVSRGQELEDRFDAVGGDELAGCDEQGRLVAILTRRGSALRPSKCFV